MATDNKKFDIAKKLWAMVNHPNTSTVEKLTFQEKLDAWCETHGIDQRDFEEVVRKRVKFYYKRHNEAHREILVGVIGMVSGQRTYYFPTNAFKRNWVEADVTEDEIKRIIDISNHHRAEFDKEYKAFIRAYRSTNDLYPPAGEDDDDDKSLTDEEYEELERALRMMRGMTPNTYRLKLNNG